MTVFKYDTGILIRYPTIVGGVILARGMTNGPTPKNCKQHSLMNNRLLYNELELHP